MAFILCIETSTTNCSVALAKDGEMHILKEDYSDQYSHAERLHQFIDEIIKKATISFEDLSAIAVSKGPGSYTGLRIGVSAAKGLCYALNIPLISVPTLESLAAQVIVDDGYIVPMLDARRMEVYSVVFSYDLKEIRPTEAEILSEMSFEKWLEKETVYFIGNGVDKFAAICQNPNARFIEKKLPSANEMVIISYTKFLKKEFESVSYFDPYYLKDFVSG